jgi:hypothetical protein
MTVNFDSSIIFTIIMANKIFSLQASEQNIIRLVNLDVEVPTLP